MGQKALCTARPDHCDSCLCAQVEPGPPHEPSHGPPPNPISVSQKGTTMQNQTPKSLIKETIVLPFRKKKFPPLGQLSSDGIKLVGMNPGSLTKERDSEEADHFPTSQSQSDDAFSSVQWKKMMEDLGDDAQTLLNKFSIKSLLLRVSRN
ncbi:hypothetical protein ElyMa_006333700 [Elysia marginata]|uniref:Uncharacterized protein n=1 Tax=Elysia marginata TaxID=1093978 RepID=A0AAV4HKA7_9GAST|nr:hypothetical protein ElyMa_006333700 [Elysia marginata]